MKSPITLILFSGAFAFAGAAFAATSTEVTVTTEQPTVNYKSEYEKCKVLPGSDQAVCRDSVGMRNSDIDREGVPTEEIGSLQSGDRCERLSMDARRDCLINDKGH
jgi:hypothetical protein